MNTPGKNTNHKTTCILISLFWMGLLSAQQKPAIYKIDQLLKRISNTDTLYVVNFWATWCKPCVAELPDFEKINQNHNNTKVKVLLVCMDFKEEINTKVVPFLQRNNYTSEVVLLDEIDGNSFINRVNKAWSGAIPATWIKIGAQQYFKEGKISYEELERKITELN